MELLNKTRDKLELFESPIVIDTDLPKYVSIEEWKEAARKGDGEAINNFIENRKAPTALNYDELKKYFVDGGEDLKPESFNVHISDRMREIVKSIELPRNVSTFRLTDDSRNNHQRKSIFGKLKEALKEKVDQYKEDRFDVLSFFSNVKKLKDKEVYMDRIKDFVECIGYAEKTGQEALKVKLFNELVINKYESILYANGYYEAISEKRLVEASKGAPRKIKVDYIKNYVRHIPMDVIKKKLKADELEVFDNYVILHYDPDDLGSEKTLKEKQKEVEKAKDPILFGVISGSNKLYHIGSWIDEYCDLTFDRLVEIVGPEVEKYDFIQKEI